MRTYAFKTWLKRVSLGALATLLLVVTVAALLLNTQWGARFIVSQAERFVPGELRVGRVTGSFAGALELAQASYRVDGLVVRVARLRVDVALAELLANRVHVSDLDAAGLEVDLPPGGEPRDDGPISLPVLVLPQPVRLEQVTVTDLRIRHADGVQLLALDRVMLRGALAAGVLELEELSAESGPDSLRLSARADTRLGYRGRMDAAILVHGPEGPVRAAIEARGGVDALELAVTGEAPAALALDARLVRLASDPAMDFRLDVDGLAPGLLGLHELPGPVSGLLEGSADLRSLSVSGWLAAAGERVDIESLAVTRDGSGLRLDRASLRGRDGARLRARGVLDLGAEAPQATLEADWADIRVPLAGDRELASANGRVRVDGRPDDYRFRVQARLAGLVPAGEWRATGHGNLSGVSLESLDAEVLEGTLAGSGALDWEPSLRWEGRVRAETLDPGALFPDWPGSLSGTLISAGELADGEPRGTVTLEDLRGSLRGRALQASAELAFRGLDSLEGELSVAAGDSRVQAGGRYGATSEARIRVQVADLDHWLARAGGSLEGTFTLSGPRDALRLAGSLQGEGVRWADYAAASLQAGGSVGLGRDASGRVQVTLDSPAAPGVALDSVGFTLEGTPESHHLGLHAALGGDALELAASGGLEQPAWRGRLEELRLEGERTGSWRLAQPAALMVSAREMELASACLASDVGELCARARIDPESGLGVESHLRGVPLALAAPLLRQALDRPLSLKGRLDAGLDLRLPPGASARAEATLSTEGAALTLPVAAGETTLVLAPLSGEFSLEEAGVLDGRLELGIEGAGGVEARVRSADFRPAQWAASPLSGSIRVALSDLSALGPLMVPLANPEGALDGEITLGGRFGAPGLGGGLELTGFATEVPQAGLALSDGSLSLHAANGGLRFSGGVTSGGGRVELEGGLSLTDEGLQADATVRGERFLAVQRPGIEAWVSPDLALVLRGTELRVTGSAAVPEALVDADHLEGAGVGASPDVVVVGREAPPPGNAWRVLADVEVALGDAVRIRAPGFEGRAQGRLNVRERPGRPTTGRGELTVSGAYEAYGQALTIRRGRLLFSGTPLDNPALNITAVREVDEVTAGVRIDGTAREPVLTLFSEPALASEAETLSYLVLGRPMDQATAGDGALLSGAATSLGLKGGDLLARQIGARFGITDIGVEQSDDLGQSALTLGKYLSPRLYLTYGVGLVETVSVIRLRYELSERWALEAASGRETSGAIKFYFER